MIGNAQQKVTTLTTPYAQEQYQEFQKQHRQLIFKRRRLAVIFAAAAFIFVVMGIQLLNEQQQLAKLHDIKTKTQAQAVKVDKNVTALKQDVSLLKNDDYVAKLARSRYYYSKDGEMVFVLPEKETTPSNQ